MPREKFQTLTEQMFCILLCLKQERYGLDILDMVPELTQGRILAQAQDYRSVFGEEEAK